MATVRVSVWTYPNGDLAVQVDGFQIAVDNQTKVYFEPGGIVTAIELDKKGNNTPPWGGVDTPKKAKKPSFAALHTRSDNDRDYHYDIIAHYTDANGNPASIKIDPVMIIRKG